MAVLQPIELRLRSQSFLGGNRTRVSLRPEYFAFGVPNLIHNNEEVNSFALLSLSEKITAKNISFLGNSIHERGGHPKHPTPKPPPQRFAFR